MEPDRLKAEFGDQLTFLRGVDTQELLPRGDSEEIDREVRRLLDCMSSNGGYVFAAALTTCRAMSLREHRCHV